tara:strand:- start:7355 stop:7783 length:429 start_codon:yes stop_codon:yes gene_type:complete
MRILKYILSKIFYKIDKEEPPLEEEEPLEEENKFLIPAERIGSSITITIDPESADFNVIVGIDNTSDECASILGNLLGMLESGEMSPYFTQAYQSWCYGDNEKKLFISKVLIHWLQSKESFSSEYENVAVKPSQVFNFQMKE